MAIKRLDETLSSESDELERLRQYVLPRTMCPGCGEAKTCWQGCTFFDDNPRRFFAMQAARRALWGEESK